MLSYLSIRYEVIIARKQSMNFPHTCYLYLFTDTDSMAVYVPQAVRSTPSLAPPH